MRKRVKKDYARSIFNWKKNVASKWSDVAYAKRYARQT